MRKCAAGAPQFVRDGVVVSGRSHDDDVVEILGGGADHRRAADVDILDQFLKLYARLGRGFLEGVEIHDHHVDGSNPMFGDGSDVLRIVAAVQDSSVNFRMQRLDASVEHFGEAGKVGDVFDVHSGLAEQ